MGFPGPTGGRCLDGWTGSEQILPQGGEVIQGFSIKMLIETPFFQMWYLDMLPFHVVDFTIVTSH